MSHYEMEIAKVESRTPLFYYPYHIEIKSDFAKFIVARYFFSKTTSYVLSFQEKHLELLNEENMKMLSGRYTFHYDDPQETEGQRIAMVKHAVPISLGNSGVGGFSDYTTGMTSLRTHLIEGKDFEVVVGPRVEIEQPVKLTFDDLPDLMGVEGD